MSGRDDPAAMLREHNRPPGTAIVPAPGESRWRYTEGYCGGELRSMYVREAGAPPPRDPKRWVQDKPKLTWRRVGYVCLRCGVVELHGDVLPLDDAYHYNKADRSRRPAAVLVPGALAATPTTPTTECPTCHERVTTTNLARHRRRRHSVAGDGVDTASSWADAAPGELTEAYGR